VIWDNKVETAMTLSAQGRENTPMMQNEYILEHVGRQLQLERVAEANRSRVRALLQSVRKVRKAPAR
jgi:hypothetical protein